MNLLELQKKHFILKLRDILVKNNYSDKLFKDMGINPYRRSIGDHIILNYKVKKDSQINILIRLFLLGSTIQKNTVIQYLGNTFITDLNKLKILDISSHRLITSNVMILPYKKYYFACDFIIRISKDGIPKKSLFYKTVYPVSSDSVLLANTLIKHKRDTALDMGTGCGFHAILSSTFTKKVTGIDINPRAINFSKFNAILNNVLNVEFKVGNLYNSVKGQTFDLIMANLPYEFTIKKTAIYKDGGRIGNDIIKKFIEQTDRYLNENGYCQIVANFFETREINLNKLLKISLKNQFYKILFIEYSKSNPEQYALGVSESFLRKTYKDFTGNFNLVIEHLVNNHVNNISRGVLTLKKNDTFIFQRENLITNLSLKNNPDELYEEYFQISEFDHK